MEIQHGQRYRMGVRAERQNIWKGRISPQSCPMTSSQGKACRDLSSHRCKTNPSVQGSPWAGGHTEASQPLGCSSAASGGQSSLIPPPSSAACRLLFKHSSCLSTTLALRGWRYLVEKKQEPSSSPPSLSPRTVLPQINTHFG